MTTIAFYDAKPYDREYFERAVGGMAVLLHHHDFRLTAETASSAQGADAGCVFVNDRLAACRT